MLHIIVWNSHYIQKNYQQQPSQTKVKIAGGVARKCKVNVNGVGQKDGVADQVGKEMDVMERWEPKEWGTYASAKVAKDVNIL